MRDHAADGAVSQAPISFTLVIPTRNESADIATTLEACCDIAYPAKEILVVDDSADDTPEIVRRFEDRGVTLIHRVKNVDGCCGARTEGMKAASGQVAMIVNADATPPCDILTRLAVHYEQGADYVIVKSVVRNPETHWGRLIDLESEASYLIDSDRQWSEGFSCRVAAARAVGWIPGSFPVPFCRDWRLGRALADGGYRRVIDLGIQMPHVVPDGMSEFFRHWIWRGTMMGPSARYFGKASATKVLVKEVLRAVYLVLAVLLVWPPFREARRLEMVVAAKGGRMPWRVGCAILIRNIALAIGAVKGAWRVLRAEGVGS